MVSLINSELRYRRLFEATQDGILILDAKTGKIEDVNPYLIKMLGYSREEFIKKKLWEVGAFKDVEASQEAFEALQENEYVRYENLPLKSKDGKLIQVEYVSNVYLVGDEKVIQCNIRDITEHKRIMVALQENEKKYHDLVNQSPDGVFIIGSSGNILTVNKAMCGKLEFSEEEFLSMTIWDLISEKYLDQYEISLLKILEGKSLVEAPEYVIRGKDGTPHWVEILPTPFYIDKDIIGFQGIARDITARKQSEQDLRESEERFRSTLESMMEGCQIIGYDWRYLFVNDSAARQGRNKKEELLGHTMMECYPGIEKTDMFAVLQRCMDERTSRQMVNEFTSPDGSKGWFDLSIQPARNGIFILSNEITHHRQAEKRIQRQLEHLTALSGIDRVISANYDLDLSLSEILKHVKMELGVDAAAILLFNPYLQLLEFGAESGFRTNAIRKAKIRLGESYAGLAAQERRLVQIPNLQEDPLFPASLFMGEDFVSFYGVPLLVKGQVKGVLEVFQRAALEPDLEWFDFLNTLAGQTAIAIEIASLFESLQNSNSQLTLAYDATIEGWSHALDLRDKETEGHTQRVTEMTVKLARAFGLSQAELAQVRWGALLHDIGKMGVPDGVLLKPGPLTDEEWVAMKKHPNFAYEMLAPIGYLRLALDIPYCHHEKWDGSGYPRGLKGEQIPLTARIFAVVDVWDALNSDRPYRAAWPEEKVLEYIRSLAGTHFDPQVVKICLESGLINIPTNRRN